MGDFTLKWRCRVTGKPPAEVENKKGMKITGGYRKRAHALIKCPRGGLREDGVGAKKS